MRQLLAVLLFFFLAGSAQAQKPVTVHLPLVLRGANAVASCDNHWKIVVPEATTNYVLNPSGEAAGNYAAGGGAVVARDATYAKYGLFSYHTQTFAAGDSLNLTLLALTNVDHFVTLRVRGELPPSWSILVRTQYRTPLLLESIDNDWNLYGVFIPAAEASTSTMLYIVQHGDGGGDFYVDGVQVEPHDHWTSYCDGTQDGCNWNGAEHASSSARSAQSRAGGRIRDFYEDYGLVIESFSGVGSPPVRVSVNNYALLPGGELNSTRLQPRPFTLTGTIFAESEKELYQKRQALAQILDPTAYDQQAVRIRFTGSEVQKEIAGIYEGGLEADLKAFHGNLQRDTLSGEWNEAQVFTEKVALRLLAPSPFWQEVGESATLLDVDDYSMVHTVVARLKDEGQWSALGPPDDSGTYNLVYAIAEDASYVYVGGYFSSFDGKVNAKNIVRWHKVTHTWSALSTGMDFPVHALVVAADGSLYAGGEFTTAGGGAAAHVAKWNGTSWSALGAGTDDIVNALAVGLDGTLYAGGNFANAGGGAAASIAQWNGTAWSGVGGGTDGFVNALAISPSGVLYAGGTFLNAGGGAAENYIAQWNGTAWSGLDNGMDAAVNALAVAADGTLYAGGNFSTAGGTTVNYVAEWNGTAWIAMEGGVEDWVYSLEVGPEGSLYAGGFFTYAGNDTLAISVARWNGSSWSHLDLILPVSITGIQSTVYALHTGAADAVVTSNYDLWVGFNRNGTAYFGGLVTATNEGTSGAHPVITFERTGDAKDATIEWLRNERIGKLLLLDYNLLDGESLVIDLTPTKKSITSNYFGSRLDAVLADSDLGTFTLQPGDNPISAFATFETGIYSTQILAWMKWRDAYLSLD